MEVSKIVLDGLSDLTSDEKDIRMLKAIEKQLGTGPIIGEAREVLLTMSRNIMVRDLILDMAGISIEKRHEMFNVINKQLDERDKEILAERAKK